MKKHIIIGIVVGETSGDELGVGFMNALREHIPNARFVGVGGPKMIAAGFESLFPMEKLAVMGITEVLKRLPELLRMRRQLVDYFADHRPAVFMGIDAPDFNLDLEGSLHKLGIRTVHYVSPSVWAWRQSRVHTIKKSVDRILTLFPFEAEFYQAHKVPVTFVGHPLADEIPLAIDVGAERRKLGIDERATMIAVMPGSREGEIDFIAPDFFRAMRRLYLNNPSLTFCLPAVNEARADQVRRIGIRVLGKAICAEIGLTISVGNSRNVMAASDAVLLASGTATLEAMLLKKPMVAAYKWGRITHTVISSMVKSPYVTLPNLLADKALVPELIQEECCAREIVDQVERVMSPGYQAALLPTYELLHKELRRDASKSSAEAVKALIPG